MYNRVGMELHTGLRRRAGRAVQPRKGSEMEIKPVDECPEEAQRLSSLFGRYFRRIGGRAIKGIQGRNESASGSSE